MTLGGPATVWRPSDGNGEYTPANADYIVDELDDYLVDPSGVFIVSTESSFTQIAQTTWTEDNSE